MLPAVTVLALSLLGADANAFPRDLLVEAADLVKPEAAAKFRVLDARPAFRYRAGHVPGSFSVDAAAWGKLFVAKPDPGAAAKLLGQLGIRAETPVVVFDDSDNRDAARVWSILRHLGVRDVRLLNGTWRAYEKAGGPVTREESKRFTPPATPALPHAAEVATKADVLAALKGKEVQIVDSRSREEFCGEVETAKRNGSVPGAKHLEWSTLLDPKTRRFKSPAELTRLLNQSGIDPRRPSITYCQSGGRSSVTHFALELMGGSDVRNYYKSWAEWGNADDTPVAKSKKD